MSNWNYDNAFERHPIEEGIAIFNDGSALKCHDIFSEMPDFMKQADLLFIDPPWNKGNLKSFYTKANIDFPDIDYDKFYERLFRCIIEIKAKTCYIEIGKDYISEIIANMKRIYKYVTFYNSMYYNKKENMCYVVRGSNKPSKFKLDYIDEEKIIEFICENETYDCIGDLCMGRGLVACNAYKNNKKFVGTELNHKRLSVTLERLDKAGAKYYIDRSKPC